MVVTTKVSPTLLRTLRKHPVALLVIAGDSAEGVPGLLPGETVDPADPFARTRVLGPRARVREGDGEVIACAPWPDELEGLMRALDDAGVGLGLSPTPPWLPDALTDAGLGGRPVVGLVPAHALSLRWEAFARERAAPTVVVPLGVTVPPLTEPEHPGLAPCVAAHALERRTGPVFPSPRVVAQVLAATGRAGASPAAAGESARALWAQARRALPLTGAVVGMDAPRGPIATTAPTAAFLAQRAVLRAERARALADEADARAKGEPTPGEDTEGVTRAEQLLRAAAQTLTDHETKVVLRGFGAVVTRQAVASSASGAAGFAERIGYPVVLKALSGDLRRRSDIGAVALGLTSGAQVRRAYAAVVAAVESKAPTAHLDGVLVAEMVPPGLDVHCGIVRMQRDPNRFAIYGRTVEAPLPIEPAMAAAPLSPVDAVLLAHAILTRIPVPGLRRADDPDVHGLAALLRSLSALAEHFADRLETLELSPVRLLSGDRGPIVLDARLTQRPHLQGE